MKRLNLLWKQKEDATYPWLLKHPKIKEGLAKFKTRQDAVDWFLNFGDEVYIWFQNSEGIFGGQLAVLESENPKDKDTKKLLSIPKVSGFDGGETYNGVCEEFSIHPSYLSREPYKSALAKRVPEIDFVLISDPATYFPADLEMKKRSQSSYVDLNAIKASLELKIKELEEQKNASDETINNLKEQLENKKFDFMKVEEEIEAIKNQKEQEINAVREEAEKKIEEVKAEVAANSPTEQPSEPYAQAQAQPQFDAFGNPVMDPYAGQTQQPVDPYTQAQPQFDAFGNPVMDPYAGQTQAPMDDLNAQAQQPMENPNAQAQPQFDAFGNPVMDPYAGQPQADAYGNNPYVQSETIMTDPYATQGGYLATTQDPYGQLTPYDANYGYPTGMYDGTQFYPVQKKSDVGIWVGVGIAATVLLVIFILDILVLLSLTNVAQIF
ncbi:hypothetical protein NPA07_00630 [Mycoplasmopsis caviae]|uniref:Uncharacterized protein n=1 Tax=Mycoplasmopsis caviae TaxID=55603 RepID=A0A3P8MDH9_9BACT|nr:hypothetical protein [Mycoplasmopsis caviae]UUD35371.1 hypothetical protein NPA07_00630 [Mycoplasmopsis caviae]VDR41850.1 Uncharacterised protein [Mycoplasmopsis caviae]